MVVYSPAVIIAAVIVTSVVEPSGLVILRISFSKAPAGSVIVISTRPEISELTRDPSSFVSSSIVTVGAPVAVSSALVTESLELAEVLLF